MKDTGYYPQDHVYHALKERLVKMIVEPFDMEGTDAETEVVTALGEIADMWPVSVKDDSEDDEEQS